MDIAKYGPWAVIAGGSEGVGAEFATQLADQGFNLVLLARKEGPLAEAADASRARGVEVRTLSVDLLAPDALDRIRQITDDIDVGLFIYNAGANTYGHEFATGDLTRFQSVIDLNIQSTAARPPLRRSAPRTRTWWNLVGGLAERLSGLGPDQYLFGSEIFLQNFRRRAVARDARPWCGCARIGSRPHSNPGYGPRRFEHGHTGPSHFGPSRCCRPRACEYRQRSRRGGERARNGGNQK